MKLKSENVKSKFNHCGKSHIKSNNVYKHSYHLFVYLNMENYLKYISIDPNKRFGKPIITGTRITVYDVLSWLANGMSKEEIISDFPELNLSQINACLSFAAQKEHKTRVA